jgi:hypothetical protein
VEGILDFVKETFPSLSFERLFGTRTIFDVGGILDFVKETFPSLSFERLFGTRTAPREAIAGRSIQ